MRLRLLLFCVSQQNEISRKCLVHRIKLLLRFALQRVLVLLELFHLFLLYLHETLELFNILLHFPHQPFRLKHLPTRHLRTTFNRRVFSSHIGQFPFVLRSFSVEVPLQQRSVHGHLPLHSLRGQRNLPLPKIVQKVLQSVLFLLLAHKHQQNLRAHARLYRSERQHRRPGTPFEGV